ncbi:MULTISPECIES: hypothetical protein [Lactobacillus]|uniref:Uncharacterized protein n=1 Tax=Lactobacillus xujianguonis TaxID=2495899 RepID=A0A437SSF8_9LACO|nr:MULTISPECIES: hypothetical protein [Lactobacillus]RVU69838.1 hypothetical protein EJK17_10965 [Lactobacillus xujianguonis]RVU77447.1 hypothetical protein EJK20_01420 [Lactobacillus xujianguonis]
MKLIKWLVAIVAMIIVFPILFVETGKPVISILLLLDVVLFIWFITYMHKHDKKKHIKVNLHKQWWSWVLIAVWLFATLLTFVLSVSDNYSTPSNDSSNTVEIAKKQHTSSFNLPGQKINSDTAKKHEFYWTDKDDKKVRYFVNDSKKITAIKVVLNPDINNTWWCQNYMQKVLHDDHLKFGNDKQSIDGDTLSNRVQYNLYSPKYKKWYWVTFAPAEGKDMVASFSMYPGKNKDAE